MISQLRSLIIQTALSYEGVPFYHQQSNHFGCDCIGLVVAVARDLGLKHYYHNKYARSPHPRTLIDGLDNGWDRVRIEHMLPGDVLVFWIKKFTVPQHLGILLPSNKFIHSFTEVNKVCISSLDQYWWDRLYKRSPCYKYKDVV